MNVKFYKAFLSATILSLSVNTSSYAEEFLVGVEAPLTGSLARVGSGMDEGIQVATKVFNETNGKHTVRLIRLDDESNPAKAIAAVEKLANDGVLAITGGYGSNNVGPASDAAHKLGVPYITSGAVADELTQRGYDNFFRINNSAGYEKAVLGLIESMKAKSVSIIYLTKEATLHLAESSEKRLKEKGIKVHMHAVDPSLTDFKPIMNKIRIRDKPDVVLMVVYENGYVGILRAAKVLKPKVKAMIGVWSLATSKMANEFPDLIPYVYGTALLPYPVAFTTEEGKQFGKAYSDLFKKDPDYLGQFGYVQTMILFKAMSRAAESGQLTRKKIAEELAKTDEMTLIGRVKFDKTGDNPYFIHRMGQHQDGKISIVWPADSATAEIKYPATPWNSK